MLSRRPSRHLSQTCWPCWLGSLTALLLLQAPSLAAQTYPVLLVPGWGDGAATLAPLRSLLVNAGWPADQVVALSFEDPVGSNASHAEEIADAVALLQSQTGAPQVDVVAHSMGGLATRRFLASKPNSVRRVVFLGTPHRGTVVAALSWGEGGREMLPGSPFLVELNQQPPVPSGTEALAIRTPVDLRIIPASSGQLVGPGVRNVEICCPSHNGLVEDPKVFHEVILFLQLGLSQSP